MTYSMCVASLICCFFFNDTATTEIYTLSLHDALPICHSPCPVRRPITAPSISEPTPPLRVMSRKALRLRPVLPAELARTLSRMSFHMSGPTTDYGAINFGANSTTPGYVTESATAATCAAGGTCSYTFTHVIPATATGTYVMGGEARETVTVDAGETTQQTVAVGVMTPVVFFSVDCSTVAPRRTVVLQSNCNNCHVAVHGGQERDAV